MDALTGFTSEAVISRPTQPLPTFLPADHYGSSRTKDDAGLRSLLVILEGLPAIQAHVRAMDENGDQEKARRIETLLGELRLSDLGQEEGAAISSEDLHKLEEAMGLLGVRERSPGRVSSLLRRAGGALRGIAGL